MAKAFKFSKRKRQELIEEYAGLALAAIINKYPPSTERDQVTEIDLSTARGAYNYAEAMVVILEEKRGEAR
jgi:hypothetical protein